MVPRVEGVAGSYALVASPAQFDGEAPTLRRAPGHGEQTDQILLELGHDMEQILQLKENGAVL
jgi:crotonobetainyl-CoA:carnitine CoA-transferase CaiB-like acyl-CoA transferase